MTLIPLVRSKDIRKKKIYTQGENLFTRNRDNEVVYLPRYCSHLGYDLSCGKVKNDKIVCPYHSRSFEGDNSDLLIKKGLVFKDVEKSSILDQEYLISVLKEEYVSSNWHRFVIRCNYKHLLSNLVDFEHLSEVHKYSTGIGLSKPIVESIGPLQIKITWSSKFKRSRSATVSLQDYSVIITVPFLNTELTSINLVCPVDQETSILYINSFCKDDFYNTSLVTKFWINLLINILVWEDTRILEKLEKISPKLSQDSNPLISLIWQS